MAEDPSAFEPFYSLKYFLDTTNFIQFVIANFWQAVNKPFATLLIAQLFRKIKSVLSWKLNQNCSVGFLWCGKYSNYKDQTSHIQGVLKSQTLNFSCYTVPIHDI